jgi:hypothetical protein
MKIHHYLLCGIPSLPFAPHKSLHLWLGGRKRYLWELFSAPFPPHPNPVHVFDIHSHSPFLKGTYLSSTSSVPKIDSSPSTLRIMARGVYRTTLPTGLRPHLLIHRRHLSSGVYSLFSQTHASSHERTTIATPPYLSSSTLDRTRVP